MKKILSWVLISVLLVLPGLAEEIDISGMTADELLTLRESINEELEQRVGSDGSEIWSGEYTVGKDILPGQYVLTLTKIVEDVNGEVRVYRDADAYEEYDYDIAELLSKDEGYYLDLSEGMILVIEYGSGTLKSAQKPSWMP